MSCGRPSSSSRALAAGPEPAQQRRAAPGTAPADAALVGPVVVLQRARQGATQKSSRRLQGLKAAVNEELQKHLQLLQSHSRIVLAPFDLAFCLCL